MRSIGEGHEERFEGQSAEPGPAGADCQVRIGRFGVPVFTAPIEATAALDGLADLADVDVRALDDDTCLGLFDALEVADRLFHSTRFVLLAELHARGLTDTRLGHVVPNQAAWRHGADQRRVRRDVTTGTALRRLPDVADALRAGTVSVDRTREVCRHLNDRTVDTFSTIQNELLALMRSRATWRTFARDVAQIASYADHDGSEPPRPRNHAAVTRSGDTLSATIDLYGPASIGFEQRVNAEADRLHRQAVSDHDLDPSLDVPSRSELLAQAFIDLVTRGATATSSRSGSTGPTADVTITVDLDEHTVGELFQDGTLLPGPTAESSIDWSSRVTDTAGDPLRWSAREWELLTCDPTITWIITAADGHPVACKPDERFATRAQRRGLVARDGGCVFPGCDAPPNWCDAHHLVPHSHRGPTDVRNMVLLCRHHHGVIHRDGWAMTVNPGPGVGEGHATITTPTGAVFHTSHQRPPTQRQPAPA